MIRIFIAILIPITLICCKDRDKCPRNFILPIEVSQIQREYVIGDTITLYSEFSKFVKGYSLNWEELENFDMKNIRWRPVTGIVQIDTIGLAGTSDVSNNFSFVKNNDYNYNVFNYSDGSSGLYGSFNFEDDKYCLEFKFVAIKKGIYFLQQGGLVETSLDDEDFKGKCNSSKISVFFEMKNRENTNFDLLLESPDPHFNQKIVDNAEDRFFRKGGFCFVVRE